MLTDLKKVNEYDYAVLRRTLWHVCYEGSRCHSHVGKAISTEFIKLIVVLISTPSQYKIWHVPGDSSWAGGHILSAVHEASETKAPALTTGKGSLFQRKRVADLIEVWGSLWWLLIGLQTWELILYKIQLLWILNIHDKGDKGKVQNCLRFPCYLGNRIDVLHLEISPPPLANNQKFLQAIFFS